MKTDIEPGRVARPPDKSKILMAGAMQNQGYSISKIELRQYVERREDKLGDYSLLTAVVETD
jgi:hypothetical protein